MTKREIFEALYDFAQTGDMPAELTQEVLGEFCQKQIASIDKTNEKSRERAAAKRAETDELTERIFDVLTEQWQSVADVQEALGDMEITAAKITSRMGKLVKAERAVKAKAKFKSEDGSKTLERTVYALPHDEDAE